MNKKAICIVLALGFPLAASAGAGPKGDFESRHGKKMERMYKELNLTEEQKPQVEAVYKEQHEKIRAIRNETRGKLEQILTPEQMAKFDEMKKKRKEQYKKKMNK